MPTNITSHKIMGAPGACWLGLILATASLALLGVSCASRKPSPSTPGSTVLIWPQGPDPARIQYVKSISSPADIGRSPSAWKRVVHAITGGSDQEFKLLKPFGVGVDEVGNLCLTDTGNHTACYCDFVRKEWKRFDAAGKTRFSSPVAIACKHERLFVADSELGKVFSFDQKGRDVRIIASPLQRPVGLAFSGESLAVVDSSVHAVFVFDLQGQLLFQFGVHGTGTGEFNSPTHVAADSQGHWLVTDSLNSRVQVFDAQGKFLAQIGSPGDAPGHFGRPKGVAVDTFGHIYVVDAMFDNVQIFDGSGQLLLNWGEGGTRPGQFGVPAGIAIGSDNQIYVADSYNHRVQIFKYLGQQ